MWNHPQNFSFLLQVSLCSPICSSLLWMSTSSLSDHHHYLIIIIILRGPGEQFKQTGNCECSLSGQRGRCCWSSLYRQVLITWWWQALRWWWQKLKRTYLMIYDHYSYRGFPLPSYTWYKVNPVTGAQEELSAAPTLFPRHTVACFAWL